MSNFEKQEFDVVYSILLEDLSCCIKKRLGLEVTDHALYRLCVNLEKELSAGDNLYE